MPAQNKVKIKKKNVEETLQENFSLVYIGVCIKNVCLWSGEVKSLFEIVAPLKCIEKFKFDFIPSMKWFD